MKLHMTNKDEGQYFELPWALKIHPTALLTHIPSFKDLVPHSYKKIFNSAKRQSIRKEQESHLKHRRANTLSSGTWKSES